MNHTIHSHKEIELLAHQFWEQRGRPCGSPEIDWLKAKRALGMEQHGNLSTVARAIGSVLGHAVGVATNPHKQGAT